LLGPLVGDLLGWDEVGNDDGVAAGFVIDFSIACSVGLLAVGNSVGYGASRADGLQVGSPRDGDSMGNLLPLRAVGTSLGASVGDAVRPEAAEDDGVGSNPKADSLEVESGMEGGYVG
jgi:hypothetical protein